MSQLKACSSLLGRKNQLFPTLAFPAVDNVLLAPGFSYRKIIEWGQPINSHESFGSNNDFLSFIPFDKNDPTDGILMVNHESLHPGFVSADWNRERTKSQIEIEQKAVGLSLLRFRQNKGEWNVIFNDPHNRRIDANTPIPLQTERGIAGSRIATGTIANCAGGQTPWGTFLSCEENYSDFYGERRFGEKHLSTDPRAFAWHKHFPRPPEHYGWVVEIEPLTGKAQKLTSLGRFAHEAATIKIAKDGRPVVYMGDDSAGRFIYKFISAEKNSLTRGTLYAANTIKGKWISLDIEVSTVLKKFFKDQTEVQIYSHEAAETLGATPQDRPEDIEIDPKTGHVIVALTNNINRGNPYGSLLKIVEKDNDPTSMEFESSTWMAGGHESGFACPDNLLFDPRGNLWMTSDISGLNIRKDPYTRFGHNGLFYIPLSGPYAGVVHQVASSPRDAEFTGPMMAPDGKSLFVCVQHPGELTEDPAFPTSQWPNGKGRPPASAVIEIRGEQFDRLMSATLLG